ncbi:hypothetical protein JCM8547_000371 [Rhodosporidiobolus lusitaniae]
MSSGEAVGSSSAVSLDALLEESSPALQATRELHDNGVGDTDDGEPIPTLASLLLSTAESLAARSSSAASTSKLATTKPQQPPFTLASSPSNLLNNPATPGYLSSLLAQPLTALQSLPTSLSNLSSSLDNDLSSLAFARYSSFLLSYTAAQSISTSFTTLSDSLAALLDSTSALEAAASSFETRVHAVRAKRERFARVRERIEEVEELLEAPSVVDACVRAGYWSEALDVAVRLEELHKRLSAAASYCIDGKDDGKGALSLLDRVRDEVGLALLSLRARVLESLLQRTLKLPGAVRGIAILRRIAERATASGKELDEDGLRLVFLTARWRCLRTELETVEAQLAASGVQLSASAGQGVSPYGETSIEENEERTRWTKRWIEAWREIVGETVGMYTEVFLSSSSQSIASSAPTSAEISDFAFPSQHVDPSAPLYLFLSTALSSLATILTQALPSITSPSSLSSLLTQLTYCSHSFARHGLDFREVLQLRERIELRLGRIIAGEFELAGRKWEKDWRSGWENSGGTGTTAAKARRSGRVPIADWLVMPEGLPTLLSTALPPPFPLSSSSATAPTWHHQPSPSLALLPPLARFLNAHATALNSLRLLPPISLFLPLRRAQAAELDRATQVLSAFTDAWLAALNATPLLAQNGFSGSGSGGPTSAGMERGDTLSEDEKQLLKEREDERKVVSAAIAWFGRAVVPWCAGALEKGVYAEVGGEGGVLEEEARGREEGVREAIRRCERLVARIEGREYVEEEEEEASNGEKVVEENGEAPSAPSATELPLLDVSAPPLDTASSVAASSPTKSIPPAEENGLPSSSLPESVDLSTSTAPPIDFSTTIPPPSDSPALPTGDAAGEAQQDEKDAPYLVGESAPPPPAAPEGGVLKQATALEAAVRESEKEEEDEAGDEEAWGV